MEKPSTNNANNNASSFAGLVYNLVDPATYNLVDPPKRPIMIGNNPLIPSSSVQQSSSDNTRHEGKGKRKVDEIDFFSVEKKRNFPSDTEQGSAIEQAKLPPVPSLKEEDITLQMGWDCVGSNEEDKPSLMQTVKYLTNELTETKAQLHQAGQENQRLNNVLKEVKGDYRTLYINYMVQMRSAQRNLRMPNCKTTPTPKSQLLPLKER